ncbi:hypothetical protein [Brazilian marseillevirus]|uniref:hypothetical protein n=1 Tax=Brazilian marseillevirus TaxID=1813599 RepID=UPI0007858EBA|nr:hypothetical protein A3303_gp334 [Brazilian marseillevirus]AMQ10842.1 hypothetical protein [Brazilian marseillevirus]
MVTTKNSTKTLQDFCVKPHKREFSTLQSLYPQNTVVSTLNILCTNQKSSTFGRKEEVCNMQSLQALCFSRVEKCFKEKTLKVEEFRNLPSDLIEQVCKFIPTSIQIRVFGVCVRWMKGVLREKAYYQGNSLNGPFMKWDDKGNVLEEAEYLNGRKNGRFVQYNPSKNTVHLLENYKNGELHGERKVYQNGALKKVENYKNGSRNGEKKVFFDGGEKVMKSLSFHRGKKEGVCKVYNFDGSTKKEVLWVKGIRVGSSR